MELWIPYGSTEIPIRVPDDNFYKILEPKKPVPRPDLSARLEESLGHPIGNLSLAGIVRPGTTVGVLIDPLVPSHVQQQTSAFLRAKLISLGIQEVKFFSRKRTSNVDSPQVFDDIKVQHFEPQTGTFTELGKTSHGTNLLVESGLLACDTRICLSLVTPHFASGFTGGPDIILPGASSLETVRANRSLMTKGPASSEGAQGILVQEDAAEACKAAGTFFSITFIPDGWGDVAEVLSGELEPVFREAVPRYLQLHGSKVDRKCDVVVVAAGKTMGTDLYHGVRVLSNALGAVKREGTIILVSECSSGIGDQSFLEYSKRFPEKKELLTELRHKFQLGSHVSLFLREVLEKHRVQLVSVLPDLYARDSFGLKPSRTASSAIQQSIRVEGKEAKILIVTRGDLTIPSVAPIS